MLGTDTVASSVQFVAELIVRCVGVRVDESKERKQHLHTHKQPNTLKAGASFLEIKTAMDVVLISFSSPAAIFIPISAERGLMMSPVTSAG